jgi:hypothetical protein
LAGGTLAGTCNCPMLSQHKTAVYHTVNPAVLTCLYFRISTNLISKLRSQVIQIDSVENGATNRNKDVFNFAGLPIFC